MADARWHLKFENIMEHQKLNWFEPHLGWGGFKGCWSWNQC